MNTLTSPYTEDQIQETVVQIRSAQTREQAKDVKLGDVPWSDSANCRDENPDLFMNIKVDNRPALDQARAICRVCVAKVPCLEYGIRFDTNRASKNSEHYPVFVNIYGGTTDRQRERIIYKRSQAA